MDGGVDLEHGGNGNAALPANLAAIQMKGLDGPV